MTLSIKDLKTILNKPKPEKEYIDVRTQNTKLFSFFSLETGAKCNRHCAFCPVSHSPREDEWMSQELFEKIIQQLVDLWYTQRIALYSYNEPVRDARLPDMLTHIRTRLPRTCIMINTNGDYFKKPEDITRLYDAGLNQMQINIYSSADGTGNPDRIAKGIEKAKQRYTFLKGMVDSLSWLDQEASIYQHIGSSKKACQVVPKWDFQPEDALDHDTSLPVKKHGISIRHHIANRAGNIPNFMPALNEPLEKMCIRPFRALTINWRGDAILCCNDYHADASAGNVKNKTLEEIWNDVRYHAYRIKLQAKDRNIHLCNTCDYAGGFYQHNVPHVTLGKERDNEIILSDLSTKQAAGF